MNSFDKDFIFGAATSAFQSEGATKESGRGPCYWDEYLNRSESTFNGDITSDFYHRYKEDLELAKDIGLNAIRISIAWTRIIPDGSGKVNEKGIEFYNKLLEQCIANGIEPYVTLHHFDTPLPLFKNGDWLDRKNIDFFVKYAKVCFENFGGKVKKWITINEPWSVVSGQYIVGHFPPNIKYDIPKAVQAMHNMMIAHSKVVELYKSMKLDGEIGIIHILESKYPITESKEDKRAAYLKDTIANRFMLDACLQGEYSKKTIETIKEILDKNQGELNIYDGDLELLKSSAAKNDFLGINYYASHFLSHFHGESDIHHNGTGKKGTSVFKLKGIGKRVTNHEIPTTDWDWPIYPKGLYDMLVCIKKEYPCYKKIYVTENGMGCKDDLIDGKIDDTPRINYIKQHMQAILDAISHGVNVKGYFLWSLMDVLSWTNGYSKRYGLIYIDFKNQKRYLKKSAYWIKKVSNKKVLVDVNSIEY